MSRPLAVVNYILGAWDLAVSGDLLLQGVIFAQTAHYFALYHSEVLALRAFVLGLLLLTTLKSMQMISILWIQNVTHFSDIRGASMMFTTSWPQQINMASGAFIAFYIQIFMCQRLWALSNNVYIIVVLMTIFTFSLIAAFIAVSLTFNDQPIVRSTWISLHFGVVFGGDLLLCGSTAYFLLKHAQYVLPRTAGLLNAILKITIQSAVPGAVCAMVTLISSQIGDKSIPARPSTLVSIISSSLLPKLYALSAMWTLNSRRAILLAHLSDQDTSSNDNDGQTRSGGRRISGGHGGLEFKHLGKVQHIQVRTQVQTMHHADEDRDLKSQGNCGQFRDVLDEE
ncbi:hypothetical protein MIND_00091500 [Mycena indigotica]|uniref:DUF6534 domain-containing protein n=1 Tax=Mycena indigotica TaxID=2126181 RepID=A0A8H6TE71_9AGAR|nr:uncharacterized protein MIND_00091500 [Mycena indigotica]KAF7315756.1 hypothetical protein MIND_00091500 [Mycena indigotica]